MTHTKYPALRKTVAIQGVAYTDRIRLQGITSPSFVTGCGDVGPSVPPWDRRQSFYNYDFTIYYLKQMFQPRTNKL